MQDFNELWLCWGAAGLRQGQRECSDVSMFRGADRFETLTSGRRLYEFGCQGEDHVLTPFSVVPCLHSASTNQRVSNSNFDPNDLRPDVWSHGDAASKCCCSSAVIDWMLFFHGHGQLHRLHTFGISHPDKCFGTSFMYSVKSSGAGIDPWGTPVFSVESCASVCCVCCVWMCLLEWASACVCWYMCKRWYWLYLKCMMIVLQYYWALPARWLRLDYARLGCIYMVMVRS